MDSLQWKLIAAVLLLLGLVLLATGCPKPPVFPPGMPDICLDEEPIKPFSCGSRTAEGYPCAQCSQYKCLLPDWTYCVDVDCGDPRCQAMARKP